MCGACTTGCANSKPARTSSTNASPPSRTSIPILPVSTGARSSALPKLSQIPATAMRRPTPSGA